METVIDLLESARSEAEAVGASDLAAELGSLLDRIEKMSDEQDRAEREIDESDEVDEE